MGAQQCCTTPQQTGEKKVKGGIKRKRGSMKETNRSTNIESLVSCQPAIEDAAKDKEEEEKISEQHEIISE